MASMPQSTNDSKGRNENGISTPRNRSYRGRGVGGGGGGGGGGLGRHHGSDGEGNDGKYSSGNSTPRGQNINHVSESHKNYEQKKFWFSQ